MNLKKILLQLALLAVFATAVEYWLGWGRLLSAWVLLSPTLLIGAAAAHVASYGVRAARIYWAESAIPRGRYPDCLRLLLINNLVNVIVPMRAGEASFPILMRRWFGVDVAHATGTLVWLRLLDLHVLAVIGALCLGRGWLHFAGAWVLLLAALALLMPLIVFALRGPLHAWLLGHPGRFAPLLARLLAGMPTQKRMLLKDLALSWAAWTIKLAALAVVFVAFSGLAWPAALLGVIGGDLSTVLPLHAPGGFGSYEAGVLALVAPAHGFTSALAAAAVNLHLFALVMALLAGAWGWMTAPSKLRENAA